MKVLILGSGGREYSIGLRLSQEDKVKKIYFAPGNGATEDIAEFVENIEIKDFDKLADFVEENSVDLTIVGPEAPLVDGVVDVFKARGLTIFGPSKGASQLEGSKVFMKNFLKKYNIPTAKYIETDKKDEAYEFIESLKAPIVVKADGLCAGKGVIIATSHQEAKDAVDGMLSGESFGDAGKKVIVEEFLDGYELSVFAICDGDDFKLLPAAQDHKRLLDGDKGPNTGGMGAYAPTPLVNEDIYEQVRKNVMIPTLEGMKKEGMPYEGVLFIGLMVVDGEAKVLEYNVRFGDPECEILMPLIKSSVFDLFYKGATKDLDSLDIEIDDRYAVCVVGASENYPYSSSTPAEIVFDGDFDKDAHISYAGVSKQDGKLMATGGRVLLAVAMGDSIKEARDKAYIMMERIDFAGKQYRKDIAYQALK
jgi:phosphoribosylamine--glycine ligase